MNLVANYLPGRYDNNQWLYSNTRIQSAFHMSLKYNFQGTWPSNGLCFFPFHYAEPTFTREYCDASEWAISAHCFSSRQRPQSTLKENNITHTLGVRCTLKCLRTRTRRGEENENIAGAAAISALKLMQIGHIKCVIITVIDTAVKEISAAGEYILHAEWILHFFSAGGWNWNSAPDGGASARGHSVALWWHFSSTFWRWILRIKLVSNW